MKKLLKSKIFWAIIVILVIILALYLRSVGKGKQVEYTIQEAKIGDIIQTVSATGKVKSASEIELNFKNAGKLAVLNIDTGQSVTAGQLLAQLKATDLAINVNKAKASLDEVKATLDKILAGSTSEDIAVSEAAVAKAETDLLNAQTDLTNTKATYSQALENERENVLVDADTALTKANISMQKVYDTLNYEGDANNFITSNSKLQLEVDNEYDKAVIKIDEAQLAYNLAKIDPQDDNIDQAITPTSAALSQVQETLDDLASLFDYVIITSVLTRSELDTLKTTINTERTTTNSSISTVQTAKQDLADARLDYQTKVEEAQNAVSVAQKSLAKAQADLDFKKAPARVEDVALYQARVKQSQAELQLAQDKYEDTILRAPINGVITEINFEIGEQTNLSQPAIKMLATENYEIEVDISESDIAKIEVGNKANITLDAFTDEQVFEGVVSKINPAQTEIQDVIYYRVTVSLQAQQPEGIVLYLGKIKPGMTANIEIQTAKKEKVLVIPLRAVKEKAGKRVVQVLENNQPREVEVVLGLRGDEGLVEVVSGLTEGMKVITFTKEK